MFKEAAIRSNLQRLIEDGLRGQKPSGAISAAIVCWIRFCAGMALFNEGRVRGNVQRLVEEGMRDNKPASFIASEIVCWMRFAEGMPITSSGLVAGEKWKAAAMDSLDSHLGFSSLASERRAA